MYVATKDFNSRLYGFFAEGAEVAGLPDDVVKSFLSQRLIERRAPAPLAAGRRQSSSRPARVSRETTASLSVVGASEPGTESSPSAEPGSWRRGRTVSTLPTSDGGESTVEGTPGSDGPQDDPPVAA